MIRMLRHHATCYRHSLIPSLSQYRDPDSHYRGSLTKPMDLAGTVLSDDDSEPMSLMKLRTTSSCLLVTFTFSCTSVESKMGLPKSDEAAEQSERRKT